jgi:hypothetical protein
MNVRVGSFLFLVLLVGSGIASAGVIVDLTKDGEDSGWSAVLVDDMHNGVVVDSISPCGVRIEIAKTFSLGPDDGKFPPNLIEFYQRLDDASTVLTIQITSEAVTNDTGADWTDYHWEIVGEGAAFDRAASESSGFSFEPFTDSVWGPAPDGWSSDHAISLDVSGGSVADGETFFPGSTQGKLYVDVDLSGEEPVSFLLKQYPTPEPGTMALLGAGVLVLLARPRRRRTAR